MQKGANAVPPKPVVTTTPESSDEDSLEEVLIVHFLQRTNSEVKSIRLTCRHL